MVALRKESVDRNTTLPVLFMKKNVSLSARRAWIEITMRRDFKALGLVALRKESVDRNVVSHSLPALKLMSLSARRAWIEMSFLRSLFAMSLLSLSARRAWIEIVARHTARRNSSVALRKESVDRNNWLDKLKDKDGSRSPQGERG